MYRGLASGVDCTPAGTSGVQTVTMPSDVPSYAIGVCLLAVNSHASTGYTIGAGSVGQTVQTYTLGGSASGYLFAGLNGSKQCDLNRDSTSITYQVVGYFFGAGTFVPIAGQTAYNVTAGSWQTLDPSAEVPAGGVAACFLVLGTSNTTEYAGGVRPKTSTLGAGDLGGDLNNTKGTVVWVKLDANRQCEGYRENGTSNAIYLIGYCTDGTWDATPESTDYMPDTTGSYQDVTLSSMARGGAAFLLMVSTLTKPALGVRKNGATWDPYDSTTAELWGAMVATDANKVLEVKTSTSTPTLYCMGFFDALLSPPASLTPTYTSDNQEALAWSAVEYEDNFRIEYQVDDGSWTFVNSPALDAVSYDHTHSQGGDKKLKWRIRAENEYGNSAWTESAVEYTTPDAPTIGTVVVVADNNITVPVTNNAAYASTHKFEKSKDGGAYSEFVEQAGVSASYTGGVADAKYNFKVRTKAPNGRLSAYSSVSADKWTSLPAPVVTCTGLSRTSVRIAYTMAATATSFRIEADDGGGYSVLEENDAASPYDRSGLTVRTSATYKVTAKRSGDSASTASSPVTGKTFSWVDGFFEDTDATRYSGVEIIARRRDTDAIVGSGVTSADPLGAFDIDLDDQWPYTVDLIAPEGVPASGVNGGVKAGVPA